MAKFIIDDPVCTIDGDDHSDHFDVVEVNAEFEQVPVTAFGADFDELLPGLGKATITFEAFQDFGTNEIHQNMWPIFINKTPVVVTVRSASAAVSATNPKFTMTGTLSTYSPIKGSKGEASKTTLMFSNAAQTGLVQSFT